MSEIATQNSNSACHQSPKTHRAEKLTVAYMQQYRHNRHNRHTSRSCIAGRVQAGTRGITK